MKLAIKISHQSNGRYRASCPCLPGCVVDADTEAEAFHKIEAAVGSYLMSLNVAPPAEVQQQVLVAPVA